MNNKEIGGRVMALVEVDETYAGKRKVHCRPGDVGVVVAIEKGIPTVKFDRTGTATMMGWEELEDE
jgi:hypothetical protein